QEEQDGGDERAGVADADPPNEIDDGESPADGNVDAPDARALCEEPADGDSHQGREAESNYKTHIPTEGSWAGKNDRTDLIGDRTEGVSRSQHRCQATDLGRIDWRLAGAHAFSSSGFGFRTAAK